MTTPQTATGSPGTTQACPRAFAEPPARFHPDRPLFRLAGAAALLALAALLIGGVGMALTTRPGASAADVLTAIGRSPWPFVAGGVGLTLVSLFDLLTIPGLHAMLGRHGRVLIVVASITAVVGDLLGIVGRLAQTALVPVGLQADGAPGAELVDTARVLEVLDVTLNTAGFLLVSVSFTCFGVLLLRGRHRAIGWIALVAGAFTALGQIPPLAPAFMIADVAYLGWYVGIATLFRRAAR